MSIKQVVCFQTNDWKLFTTRNDAAAEIEYERRQYQEKLAKLEKAGSSQFTQDELKSLLQLVHPDKHGGKESAIKLTQKINQLRK